MFANIAFDEIDSQRAMLEDVAKQIWDNPEIYGNETFACELYTLILKQNCFAIEEGVAGLPTAFRASWGNGHPVIGFLGEYDALPGMSQKICTHKEPVVEGANGHACGHNLVGVGCLGAVLGLKKRWRKTICPARWCFTAVRLKKSSSAKSLWRAAAAFKSWTPLSATIRGVTTAYSCAICWR